MSAVPARGLGFKTTLGRGEAYPIPWGPAQFHQEGAISGLPERREPHLETQRASEPCLAAPGPVRGTHSRVPKRPTEYNAWARANFEDMGR